MATEQFKSSHCYLHEIQNLKKTNSTDKIQKCGTCANVLCLLEIFEHLELLKVEKRIENQQIMHLLQCHSFEEMSGCNTQNKNPPPKFCLCYSTICCILYLKCHNGFFFGHKIHKCRRHLSLIFTVSMSLVCVYKFKIRNRFGDIFGATSGRSLIFRRADLRSDAQTVGHRSRIIPTTRRQLIMQFV